MVIRCDSDGATDSEFNITDSEFNITIINRPKTSKKCGQHAKSYEQFQHRKYKKVLKRMPKMKKTKEQR